MAQIVAGDIQRQIGPRLCGLQQDAHLAERTGAELHDLGVLAHQRCDFGRMAPQKRGLGAGLVVFRQFADLVEQMRTRRVVEILCADLLGRLGQSRDQGLGEVFNGRRRVVYPGELGVHQISSARRMPLNCQRAAGGKKLR